MAYERGLLTQLDVNEIQERLLMCVLIEKQLDEFKKSEDDFDRQLMIHRPDVWNKIQEEREEAQEMGFDEIVWKSPDSLEEFEEIEKLIMGTDFIPVDDGKNTTPIVSTHFDGIDFSELGDDE